MADATKLLFGHVNIYVRAHRAQKTITLASVVNGDTVIINGLTFTAHTDTTTASSREFSIAGTDGADAAALAALINNATYGVPGVSATVDGAVITLYSASVTITATTEDAQFTIAAVTNDPVSGNTVSWSGWTQLGYQGEDGLTETPSADIHIFNIPEIGQDIDAELMHESAEVEVALQEGNAALMQYALPGATYAAGATPGTNPNLLGIGGGSLAFYSIGFEGENRGGQTFVVFYPKVFAMGPSSRKYSRQGVTLTPFKWKALGDASRTAGHRLREMWEITSAA